MPTNLSRRDLARLTLAGAACLAPGVRALARPAAATPLFDFAIAGGWYYDLGRALPTLAIGERLVLKAEPDNPHDGNAVAVTRSDGAKLGYVPRAGNAPVAWVLASGGAFEAEIVGRLNGADADLVATSFMAGDPRVRLSLIDGAGGVTLAV